MSEKAGGVFPHDRRTTRQRPKGEQNIKRYQLRMGPFSNGTDDDEE